MLSNASTVRRRNELTAFLSATQEYQLVRLNMLLNDSEVSLVIGSAMCRMFWGKGSVFFFNYESMTFLVWTSGRLYTQLFYSNNVFQLIASHIQRIHLLLIANSLVFAWYLNYNWSVYIQNSFPLFSLRLQSNESAGENIYTARIHQRLWILKRGWPPLPLTTWIQTIGIVGVRFLFKW